MVNLTNNGGRVGVFEKDSGRTPAVSGDHPDVIIKSVQNLAVVKPFNLVIHTARLGERDLNTGAQIDDIKMPAGFCEPLESNTLTIWRKRWTLDADMNDPDTTGGEITFDQIVLATRPQSGVEAVPVNGKGNPPEVEIDLAEKFPITLDGEFLEFGDQATIGSAVNLTRVEKLPGVYECPLTKTVIAAWRPSGETRVRLGMPCNGRR